MPTDPLQLPLRDIHLPDGVSMWPLAPGWWILFGLCLVSACLAWFLYRRYLTKKYAAITLARQDLEDVRARLIANEDPKRIINDISILLRRVSISIFPRHESASLTGHAWLTFLDETAKESVFATPAGNILIEGPYRPSVSRSEIEPLLELSQKWIESVEKHQGSRK